MMLLRLAIPMVALTLIGMLLFGPPRVDAADDRGGDHVTVGAPISGDAEAEAPAEPWLLAAAVAIVAGALWIAPFATPRREEPGRR